MSLSLFALTSARAGLSVDFDKVDSLGGLVDGSRTEEGFASFGVQHETIGQPYDLLRTETYTTDEGDISVRVDVDTGNPSAYQGIQRGVQGYDGEMADLAMDWTGYDSRTGATTLTLELGGLAAGSHTLRSYHQDTFDQTGTFDVFVDGIRVLSGVDIAATADNENPGPGNPPKSVEFEFEADGSSPVTIDYKLTSGGNSDVIYKFFVINGFEIDGGGSGNNNGNNNGGNNGGGGDGGGELGHPVISEFLASNDDGLTDSDGEAADWIEIYNATDAELDLEGWYLTDDPGDLDKWRFPAVMLDSGEYLVVFASGKDMVEPLSGRIHTSFQVERDEGGYLALVHPDGETVVHEYAGYVEQNADVSYGYVGDVAEGNLGFFQSPTPGAANNAAVLGFVQDTAFSVDRGFYYAPFTVFITSATPDVTVRYTLDGSEPTLENGETYDPERGVEISTTTTLRAAAFKSGWEPTNVDTQTYIFVEDVARQPDNPPGWPSDWGTDSEVGLVPADYEMDPRVVAGVVNGVEQKYTVEEALLDIPTLSIVMDPDDFIDRSSGIYTNPKNRGDAWERPASLELIYPDGREGFNVMCGIRMQGNSSRRPARMQKHSFRVSFRNQYGDDQLDSDFIPGNPIMSYNKLVLRACFTDSWGLVSWSASRYRPDDSQYFRDVWVKDSLLAMGQPSARGTFCHLYVNGLYWGVYNPAERIDDDFISDHLGGEEEDWDIIYDFGEIRSGNKQKWNEMLSFGNQGLADDERYWGIQGRNADGTASATRENLVDVANLADYMLLHIYANVEDWPHHNWYAARPRDGSHGFRFLAWDQEIALDNHNINNVNVSDRDTPAQIYNALRANANFRLLFGDRVQKHLFNDGALTIDNAAARYMKWANLLDKAIVAESARWGDVSRNVPFTRDKEWIETRDYVVNEYIPEAHRLALERLESAGLIPQTEPPKLNQYGGNVPKGFRLTMSAGSILDPNGSDVYYTTDGTDPRAVGGSSGGKVTVLLDEEAPATAVVPLPENGGDQLADLWKGAPENEPFDDSGWIQGETGVGYERTPENFEDLINLHLEGMEGTNTSAFMRVVFQVSDQRTIDELVTLALEMRYDDGFIAYLNGEEVASRNAPENPAWDSQSTDSASDQSAVQYDTFNITDSKYVLRPGRNVLAIHILNHSLNSSDLLASPRLVGGESVNVNVTPSAQLYTGAITLDESIRIMARSFNGQWSALQDVTFIVDAEPATTENLVISRLYYHPEPPTAEEIALGFTSSNHFEFIELTNVGDSRIDLRGVRFFDGVEFNFDEAEIKELGAGEKLYLPRKWAAFEHRFTAHLPLAIAGQLADGKFSDNGERIWLVDADGATIMDFEYNDRSPWPEGADGDGMALGLKTPFDGQDPAEPSSWVAVEPLGDIGSSGGFADWAASRGLTGNDALPDADPDANGLSNLLEFALALDIHTASGGSLASALPQVMVEEIDTGGETDAYFVISLRLREAPNSFGYFVESSADAVVWERSGIGDTGERAFVNLSDTDNGDGTREVRVRTARPVSELGSQFFVRLAVEPLE